MTKQEDVMAKKLLAIELNLTVPDGEQQTCSWISIKDRLPTHHQDVIVYRYDGARSSIDHSLYIDGQVMVGFGNVADEGNFFDNVYYWQPIETKALYEAMLMQLQISEVTGG